MDRISDVYKTPGVLLQNLIKFNTSNPPGNELECQNYIKTLLDDAGIENYILCKDTKRPNLYARINSKNVIYKPLLLYGHVDVVPVDGQEWSVDPFLGVVKDGYIWGRGAIDMKGEVSMFIAAMIKIKSEGIELPFDLIMITVSDEESEGDFGMKFLVKDHPEIFKDIKFALGEVGGFSFEISGKKLYPIMIGEKQITGLRITAKGKGGHASFLHHNTAVTRIANAIVKLDKKRLPVRITPEVRLMIQNFASAFGGIKKIIINQLLNPALTDLILGLLGDAGRIFDPLLHNNVNVTKVYGGNKINVIPSTATIECDFRLVPGCKTEEAIAEIQSIIGSGFDVQVFNFDENNSILDNTLFESLSDAIKEVDSLAIPVPFVLAAVTDGRFLSKLGIQTYGFTPMDLPADYDFISMAHAADERVPLTAIDFGVNALIVFMTKHYKGGEFNGK